MFQWNAEMNRRLFEMSVMNDSAFFVTLAAIFLLVMHTLVPSALLTMALVVLLPLAITAGLFRYLEGHQYKDRWVSAELEEYEKDPDCDYYVSMLK